MKLSDFDYDLPETAIAIRPPEQRGSTRLQVLDKQTGAITDSKYSQLDNYLEPGDVLVINNTKVIKARLIAHTESGAERELLLLEKHGEQADTHHMKVMYRRKLRTGMKLFIDTHEIVVEEILGDGLAIINSTSDLLALAETFGNVPLPPYMHRDADKSDVERYQTVFAHETGSVAAPTASLNLTDDLLQRIKNKGVVVAELTLHVGLGTFMPIRTDNVEQHKMHQEYFHIPMETIDAIRNAKRVVAVGTTVTRTLEFAADEITNATSDIHGEADIFIYPGYGFKLVDALVTNFHAPHSTVLMMAAAFAGWDNLKGAYEHALQSDYKFLSYGDSMLIH
jgi:S-adenosylmethionine:tRNA ribosyltransferase-isomerase